MIQTRIGVGDLRLSDKAKQNVMSVLDSDRLTYGPMSREFERRFADVHGKQFAVFVSSGTDALNIGLAAMKEKYGWGKADRIALPAVTFVATLNVILQNGLLPYFVDVEMYDYGMQSRDLPYNVVGAIHANLFGHVSPAKHMLPTLTDSCETMFMPGCSDGEIACFSTYTAHLITTGVGGLVVTDDPVHARLARSLANHGRSGIYTGIDDPLGVREKMDARFFFERQGFSSRGTELQAALGCAELDVWKENISARQRNARILMQGLSDLPLDLPKWTVTDSSWMMCPILSDRRDDLLVHLEERGIETRPMLPLTSQPYVRKLWSELTWRDIDTTLPNATLINNQGFYVGCHQYLGESEMTYMVDAFRSFYC